MNYILIAVLLVLLYIGLWRTVWLVYFIEWLVGLSYDLEIFVVTHTPAWIFAHLSKIKLLEAYRRASRRVPAYKAICPSRKIRNFKDFVKYVPVVDKENYMKPNLERVDALCLDGNFSDANILMSSSGSTQKFIFWPRSRKEFDAGVKNAKRSLNYAFDVRHRKTLMINNLTLGVWIAGIRTGQFMVALPFKNAMTINVGPDINITLETLAQFGDKFDQIIIYGYPPFIKNLLEEGVRRGTPWKKYRIYIVAGGEGISEKYRNYIAEILGIDLDERNRGGIYSSMGAAEFDLNMFHETFDIMRLRRLAAKDADLRVALFGSGSELMPMFFQYDPFRNYVEIQEREVNTEKGPQKIKELLISTLHPYVKLPLIRYNIHDIGLVIPYAKLKQILKSRGYAQYLPRLKFPFVTVAGRFDTVSLNGANIYPDYIFDAIYGDPELAKATTGRFKILKIQGEEQGQSDRIQIDFELVEGACLTPGLVSRFENQIFETLKKNSEFQDFVYHIFGEAAKPQVVLYAFGKFPHVSDSEFKIAYFDKMNKP